MRREARKAIEMLAEVAHTHNDDAARLEVENLTRIEQANQDEWDREQSSRQDAAQNVGGKLEKLCIALMYMCFMCAFM